MKIVRRFLLIHPEKLEKVQEQILLERINFKKKATTTNTCPPKNTKTIDFPELVTVVRKTFLFGLFLSPVFAWEIISCFLVTKAIYRDNSLDYQHPQSNLRVLQNPCWSEKIQADHLLASRAHPSWPPSAFLSSGLVGYKLRRLPSSFSLLGSYPRGKTDNLQKGRNQFS